ncbi:hypothetical protein OH807_32200 [Kitasatospora sp. NBC_01560]|uniref:hypothetical protein n=1 Tax=Kitasatospora sp. NBC_01560 TaxID=2975965 RepID=UPI00386705F6
MTRIEQQRTGHAPSHADRSGHGRAHREDPRHAGPHDGPRHAAGKKSLPEPTPAAAAAAAAPIEAPAPDRPDGASLQVFPAVRRPGPDLPAAVPAAPAAPPLPAAAPQAPTGEVVARTAAPARASGGGLGPWLDAAAVQESRADWEHAQITFVDDPAGAVAAADTLVERTADLVAEAVRRRLEELREGCRTPGGEPGARTEQLRLAMRDYRSALDRLLS